MKNVSKEYVNKFFIMSIAIVIIALGITGLRLSNFGTDPFNCMNIGVSSHLPISYGTYQLIVNIILFIPLVIIKPEIMGPGAIMNMFFLAYIVDFFMWMFKMLGITIDGLYGNILIRSGCLMAGVLCVCIGVAIYMECQMGTAAYDALGMIIEEKSKGRLKYRYVRIATDIVCVTIGILFQSVVGIGTVIGAFFTGPLISMFRKMIRNLL